MNFNYTKTNDYATVRDLLGGEFWTDVDGFAERELNTPNASADIVQNNLNDPNRRAKVGDRIGWDYSIYALKAQAWLQNQINTAKWDVNYGLEMSYEQFYRQGYMRNGRAPENSFGKSGTVRFNDAMFKAGATYKLNGRNYFTLQAQYGTVAPVINDVYISPRIKDTTIDNPKSTRVFSIDGRYTWNYRRFRGSITAYFTDMNDAVERYGFWDESLNAFCNFALSGVHRQYKGIELGMAYQITSSLRATFAGNFARYRYANNPSVPVRWRTVCFPTRPTSSSSRIISALPLRRPPSTSAWHGTLLKTGILTSTPPGSPTTTCAWLIHATRLSTDWHLMWVQRKNLPRQWMPSQPRKS